MDLPQRLLTSLGAPVVKTDANGLFVINATPDSWLVAMAKRKVADQVSIYFWIFAIKDHGLRGQLLISNDTLIEQTAGLVTVLESLKAQRSDPLPVPRISVSPELTDWISKSKEEIRVVLPATKTKAAADAQKFLESLRISDPTPAGHSKVLGIEGVLRIPVRWIPKGRFRMGSSIQELGRFRAETEHEVILTHGYFLAETEYTQEQCDAIMARNRIKAKSEGN